MNNASLAAELVDLAHAIAPELAPQPLYVLLDLPASLPMPTNCGGYTPLMTCPLLRQTLIDCGEWRGPGPQIVVDASKCERDTEGNRRGLRAIFIHELAHALPFVPRKDVDPTPEEMSQHAKARALWQQAATDPLPGTPRWKPFHGLRFVRACLHLVFRCQWHQWPVDLESVRFAGGDYDLSFARDYQLALADEPARMLDASFREILATPAPEAFTNLFAADCERWNSQKEAA